MLEGPEVDVGSLGRSELEALLFRNLMDDPHDIIYFKDHESRYLRLSRGAEDALRAHRDDGGLGASDADHYAPHHAELAARQERDIIESGRPLLHVIEEQSWPDGMTTWVSTTKLPLCDDEGRIVGTFGISRDVTVRVEAETQARRVMEELALAKRALEIAEAEARTLVDLSPDSIVRFDPVGRYVFLNRSAIALTDRSPADLIGRTLRELGHPVAVLDVWEPALRQVVVDARPQDYVTEHLLRGQSRAFHTHLIPELDTKGGVVAVLAISRDVTQDQAERSVLRHEATHDALTGLRNRGYLERYLADLVRSPGDGLVALLFADVDAFKSVNDDHGHLAGDQVLQEVAARLLATARSNDVVARLGGDEFVVVMQLPSRRDAPTVAARYRRALSDIPVPGTTPPSVGTRLVSVSVGIAVHDSATTRDNDRPHEAVATLLSRADRAMYDDKPHRRPSSQGP